MKGKYVSDEVSTSDWILTIFIYACLVQFLYLWSVWILGGVSLLVFAVWFSNEFADKI